MTFYYNGSYLLGTQNLSSAGLAVLTIPNPILPAAIYGITAVYQGDGGVSYAASSPSTSLSYEVKKANTATTVTASLASAYFGQSVTFTATVALSGPGAGVPNYGTVTFYDGPVSSANQMGDPLSLSTSGVARLPWGALSVTPSHTINAVYSGNINFAGSPGTLTPYAVNKAGSSTTVTASSANTIPTYGQPVTLRAVVTPGPGAGVPSGTLKFYDGSATPGNELGQNSLGTPFNVSVLNGVATLVTTSLRAGTDKTITAVYAGDTNFVGSNGTLTPFTVSPANTTTVISRLAGKQCIWTDGHVQCEHHRPGARQRDAFQWHRDLL